MQKIKGFMLEKEVFSGPGPWGFPEGEVLAGEIPGKQLRNAQTFIDLRNEELMLNWKLCMDGKDVVCIDPIR